jgi:DNA-directed RNA polymerase alpha subunit
MTKHVKEWLSLPVEESGLSPRLCNMLRRSGVRTLLQLTQMTPLELYNLRKLSPKTYDSIKAELESRKIMLKDE